MTSSGQSPKVAPLAATLAAISDAAERCLRFDEIGGALGLAPDEWRALVRSDPAAVALAVARGRTAALVENAQALRRCVRFGSADAALFILQRDHGWPKPKRGRPARLAVPADLPPK
jgi:hypothetical protein